MAHNTAIYYYIVLAIIDVLLVASAGYLFARRSQPNIKYRSVPLTLLSALGLALCINAEILELALKTKLLCNVPIWILSIATPFFTLCTLGRLLRLAFLYHSSKAKLIAAQNMQSGKRNEKTMLMDVAAAVRGAEEEGQADNEKTAPLGKSKSHISLTRSVRPKDSDATLSSTAPTNSALDIANKHASDITAMEDNDELFLLADGDKRASANQNMFLRHSSFFSVHFLLRCIAIMTFFHTLVMVVVQAAVPKEIAALGRLPSGQCEYGWFMLPADVLALCYVLAFSIALVWILSEARDSYGMRVEFGLLSVTVISSMVIRALISFVPSVQSSAGKFPPTLIAAVLQVLLYMYIVALPVVDSSLMMRQTRGDSQREYFQRVLTDPYLFLDFKRFSIQTFSVENPLFYEQITALQRTIHDWQAQLVNKGGSVSGGDHRHEGSASMVAADKHRHKQQQLPVHITQHMNRIYRTFVRPGSQFQLNLQASTVVDISRQIQASDYSPTMFDRAKDEAVEVMYQHTFARYLRNARPGGIGSKNGKTAGRRSSKLKRTDAVVV